MGGWLLARDWLEGITRDYAATLGVDSDAEIKASARQALHLLQIAPWHLRLMVGCAEIAASLWCAIYRVTHGGKNIGDELSAFAKIPVIAPQLLRVYRSLTALCWFEQPSALAALGTGENLEARQARFRAARNGA